MTTLLLKASRVLELPGQNNKKLNHARNSLSKLLKAVASRKEKTGSRKADLHEINEKRRFSASEIDFAQYQQNRSLL